MNKYLDRLLTNYFHEKRNFLGSEHDLRVYFRDTWMKDHGWNDHTELFNYVADHYSIPDRYLEYLSISFVPVTEEFLKKKEDSICAKYMYETIDIEFDAFLKEENRDLIPICIVKYKCPYSEDESFSSVIDFDGPERYEISPSTEFSMTIFDLIKKNNRSLSEKASVVLFKKSNYRDGDPVVGVTHYPFNLCKNIMYIGINSLKTVNSLSVPFEDDVLKYLQKWIAFNRSVILKYWNEPNYSSEMLKDDIKLGGIYD